MKLDLHEEENALKILSASKSSLYERVYFLGPYAKRVSFSSQQNRALNLVWALDGLCKIPNQGKQKTRIAVIGGGLSGLTTCAALQAKGHEVYLYESALVVLHRQMSANHRYIHPSVNLWPEVSPDPTTVLPYFDWISDACNELMKLLSTEWNQRVKSNPDSMKVCTDAIVEDFLETEESVAVVSNNDMFSDVRFDLVIVTSGFKDETLSDVKGIDTYWRSAGLDVDIASGKHKRFLVSGCGDGGLIDCLRIAHKHFDSGRLVVRIAEILSKNSKWAYAAKILEAENLFESPDVLESAIISGSQDLQKVYTEAAKNLPRDIQDILGGEDRFRRSKKSVSELDVSLKVKSPGLVQLITMEKFPFNPMAAPIHKLLIAHAINNHIVNHIHGEVQDGYSIDKLSYRCLSSEENTIKHLNGRVVIRHGSKPNFEQFFKDNKAASRDLISAQKMLASNLDKPLWRAGNNPLMEWPPILTPFEPKHLAQRKSHAIKILSMNKIYEKMYLDTEIGFYIKYKEDADHVSKLDLLPDKLFGFPFKHYPYGTLAAEDSKPFGLSPVSSQKRMEGKSQEHEETLSGRQVLLQAGAEIVSNLSGRMGPILRDKNGKLYGTTVGHVLFHGGEKELPWVYSSEREIIGKAVATSAKSAGLHIGENICLFELQGSYPYDSGYGIFSDIAKTVPEDDVFGIRVLLQKSNGEISKGFVSATGASTTFIHPSLNRRVVIENAYRISPLDTNFRFSDGGDSGAPVTDEIGRLIGLIVSGNDEHTFILPIDNFLLRTNLRILSENDKKTSMPQGDIQDDKGSEYSFGNVVWNFAEFNRKTISIDPLDLGDDPISIEGE